MFSNDKEMELLARSAIGATIEYLWRQGFMRDGIASWKTVADDVRLVDGTRVAAHKECSYPFEEESKIHTTLRHYQLFGGGTEWFRPVPKVIELIKYWTWVDLKILSLIDSSPVEIEQERVYSVKEISRMFMVGERTVLYWINSGQLRGVNTSRRVGSKKPRWRVHSDQLKSFQIIRGSNDALDQAPRAVYRPRGKRPKITTEIYKGKEYEVIDGVIQFIK